MLRIVFHRLLQTIVVVFVLVSFTFVAVRLVPGNPFVSDKALPEHLQESVYKSFGLNGTWGEQYVIWWRNVLTKGDFGPSTSLFGRSVNEIITQSFPTSLLLGLVAMTIALLIGIPSGVLAALRKNSMIDYGSMIFAMAGICIPGFVLGPLLQLWVARHSNFFNVAGWESPADILLPAITLGVGVAAYVARLTRGGMLDILSQDFIRTARAKGVPTFTILRRHALRPALLPTVTFLGPAFAAIITGSFVVETIFMVPGMGQHFVTAVTSQDYFLLQAIVLFYGLLIGGANFLVDVAQAAMNPRLRDAN